MLCITGDVLEEIHQKYTDRHLLSRTVAGFDVFARTSPNQKDFIVSQLNKEGFVTLMCGDGTNDVGSLKRANVGLAIINKDEPSKEDKKKF